MIPDVDCDSIVYLNGDYVRLGDAKISVLDRGFIFGDGIYDVVPAYNGKPFRMDGHLARLERSLASIAIKVDLTRHDWEQLVEKLLKRSSLGDCMVYIQVSRGVAKRDHAFPKNVKPTVFCMVAPFTRPDAVAREQGYAAVSMPDIRWLRRKSDTAQLAQISAGILDNLWQMLQADGKLLFVTCSLWPQESEAQAAAFALRNQAIRLPAPGQLLPTASAEDDHDGLFYALFQKAAT